MSNPSKTTKRMLTLALAAILGSGAFNASAQDEHKHHKMHGETSQEITLFGEVLDMYCFMKHPENGQGPEHAKCAKNCMKKGLPIGFLSDGEVYVLIGKDHESAKDIVADYAGMQARLTGILIEHHGVKSIEVNSIEEVPLSNNKASPERCSH